MADEIAAVFGIPAENIQVISPFVGGAFGSGLRAWSHVTLATLGARVTKRPVKFMLSRREMYYGTGYRPDTVQRVALGASRTAVSPRSSTTPMRRPPPTRNTRRRSSTRPGSCIRARTSRRGIASRA